MKPDNRSNDLRQRNSRQRGFTLLELMIVVAVLAIIVAFAIPNYEQYKKKGRRSDAHTLLMQLVSKQEQFFQDNRSYSNDFTQLGTTATLKATAVNNASVTTDYYTVTITIPAAQLAAGRYYNYTLTATPIAGTSQADDECTKLTIDQDGTKGYTLAAGSTAKGCW